MEPRPHLLGWGRLAIEGTLLALLVWVAFEVVSSIGTRVKGTYMETQLKRDLILTEVRTLRENLRALGQQVPETLEDTSLEKLSDSDLGSVKRELRDLLRTLKP